MARFGPIHIATSRWVLEGARGGGAGAWTTGHGIEIVPAGAQCGDNGSLLSLAPGFSDALVSHVHAHGENNDFPITGVKGTGGNEDLTFRFLALHRLFGPSFQIGDWKDVRVEQSYIADVRSTGAGDPFCEHWHAEGVSSIGENINLTFRYNLWDRIGGTAVFAGVNGGTSTDWFIYGNILARSVTTVRYYDDPGTSNQQSMHGLLFSNNVVVGSAGGSVGTIAVDAGSDNRVTNNI